MRPGIFLLTAALCALPSSLAAPAAKRTSKCRPPIEQEVDLISHENEPPGNNGGQGPPAPPAEEPSSQSNPPPPPPGPPGCLTEPLAGEAFGLAVPFVKEEEGYVGETYDDVGQTAIGYGHGCFGPCPEINNEQGAHNLLVSDLQKRQGLLLSVIRDEVRLSIRQFAALLSWAFNIGDGATETSSLVARLNALEDPMTVLEEELPLWKKGGGDPDLLLPRRNRELEMARGPAHVFHVKACPPPA